MPGVKGKSGRKSKLKEWNYHQLVLNSDRQLIAAQAFLDKKIKKHGLEKILKANTELEADGVVLTSKDKKEFAYIRRLYYKLMDIGQTLILRAMPSKVEWKPDFGKEDAYVGMLLQKMGIE